MASNRKNLQNKNGEDLDRKAYRNHLFQHWWARALAVLAAIVVFCTVYVLILPATAVSTNNASEEGGFYLEGEQAVATEDGSAEGGEYLANASFEEQPGTSEPLTGESFEADGNYAQDAAPAAEEPAEAAGETEAGGDPVVADGSAGDDAWSGSGMPAEDYDANGGDPFVDAGAGQGGVEEGVEEAVEEEETASTGTEGENPELSAADGTESTASELSPEEGTGSETESAESFNEEEIKESEETASAATESELIPIETESTTAAVDTTGTVKEVVMRGGEFDIALILADGMNLPADTSLVLTECFAGASAEEAAAYKANYARITSLMAGDRKAVTDLHFYKLALMSAGSEISLPTSARFEIRYHQNRTLGTNESFQVIRINEDDSYAICNTEIVASTASGTSAESADEAGQVSAAASDGSFSTIGFDTDAAGMFAFVTAERAKKGQLEATDNSSYNIAVNYSRAAGIPADAHLGVREIAKGTDEYSAYWASAQAAVDGNSDATGEVREARFFDITILDRNGREITPAIPVKVNIQLLENETIARSEAASTEGVHAVHFDEANAEANLISASADVDLNESASVDTGNTEVSEVSFDAESFSVYGIVYTVEFIAGEEDGGAVGSYSVVGGQSALLSAVLENLYPNDNYYRIENVVDAYALDPDTEEDSEYILITEAENGGDYAITAFVGDDPDLTGVNADVDVTFADGSDITFAVRISGRAAVSGDGVSIAAADGSYLPEKAKASVTVRSDADAAEAVKAVEESGLLSTAASDSADDLTEVSSEAAPAVAAGEETAGAEGTGAENAGNTGTENIGADNTGTENTETQNAGKAPANDGAETPAGETTVTETPASADASVDGAAVASAGTDTANVQETAPEPEDVTEYQVFDISLKNVNVEKYEDGFKVDLTLPRNVTGRNFHLYHVHDGETEELALEKTSQAIDSDTGLELLSAIHFVTPDFSDFVLSYTVDFAYSYTGYEYSLEGDGAIRLSELAQLLGLYESNAGKPFALENVRSVVFSDPTLLAVSRTEDGDWLLESLEPFTSEETLTIHMADGSTFVIEVTDDQVVKESLSITTDIPASSSPYYYLYVKANLQCANNINTTGFYLERLTGGRKSRNVSSFVDGNGNGFEHTSIDDYQVKVLASTSESLTVNNVTYQSDYCVIDGGMLLSPTGQLVINYNEDSADVSVSPISSENGTEHTVRTWFLGDDKSSPEQVTFENGKKYYIVSTIYLNGSSKAVAYRVTNFNQTYNTGGYYDTLIGSSYKIIDAGGKEIGGEVSYNPNLFTREDRLYCRDYNDPNNYNEAVTASDSFTGYDFMSNEILSNELTEIKLHSEYEKDYKIILEFDPQSASIDQNTDGFYLVTKIDHRTTGVEYYVRPLNIQAGLQTYEIDLYDSLGTWCDGNGNTVKPSSITGRENITSRICVWGGDKNNVSFSNLVKVTTPVWEINEGDQIKGFTVKYSKPRESADTGKKTIIRDYVTFDSISVANDYNFLSILGSGANYGINAERFEQGGHIQSNFAANYYSSGNIVEPDLAGNGAVIVISDYDLSKGYAIEIGGSHVDNTETVIYLGHNGTKELVHNGNGRDWVHVIPSKTEDLQNNIVNPILQHGENISQELLNHPISFHPSTKYIDLLGFPENATIYLDGDELAYWLAKGDDGLYITKHKDQVIVFNYDSSSDVKLGQYHVRYAAGEDDRYSVSTGNYFVSNSPTGKGSEDNVFADYLAQHIVYNLNSVKNATLDTMVGIVLAPRSDSDILIDGTSAGWIISSGLVRNSGAEWHSVYSEMPDSSTTNLSVLKKVDGLVPNGNQKFNFELSHLKEDRTWENISTKQNTNSAVVFNGIDKINDGWNIYRIKESTTVPASTQQTGVYTVDGRNIYAVVDYVKTSVNGKTVRIAGYPTYYIEDPENGTIRFKEDNWNQNANSIQGAFGTAETGIKLSPLTNPTFENETAKDRLTVKKTVKGTTVSNKEFPFTLYLEEAADAEYKQSHPDAEWMPCKNGREITVQLKGVDAEQSPRAVTLGSNGEYNFTLKNGQSAAFNNLPVKFRYRVVEGSFAYAGYSSSESDSTGTTGIVEAGQVATAAVVNKYEANGSIDLHANKTLVNADNESLTRALVNRQFGFELYSGTVADGTPLQTQYNDADGRVTFDTISYTQDDMEGAVVNSDGTRTKTVTYTVHEINGDAGADNGSVTYDTDKTIQVTLTDDGAGHITAVAGGSEIQATFVNTYTEDALAEIEGSKTLTGRDMLRDEFTFHAVLTQISTGDVTTEVNEDTTLTEDLYGTTVRAIDGKNVAASDGTAGEIQFPQIRYTKAGVYTYTVSEDTSNLPQNVKQTGRSSYTAVVTVTADEDGQLHAQVTYPDGAIAFTNECDNKTSVSVQKEWKNQHNQTVNLDGSVTVQLYRKANPAAVTTNAAPENTTVTPLSNGNQESETQESGNQENENQGSGNTTTENATSNPGNGGDTTNTGDSPVMNIVVKVADTSNADPWWFVGQNQAGVTDWSYQWSLAPQSVAGNADGRIMEAKALPVYKENGEAYTYFLYLQSGNGYEYSVSCDDELVTIGTDKKITIPASDRTVIINVKNAKDSVQGNLAFINRTALTRSFIIADKLFSEGDAGTTGSAITYNWNNEEFNASGIPSDAEAVTDENGQNVTRTLSSSNNWRDSFSNLPKYDSEGREYTYYVKEVSASTSPELTGVTYTGNGTSNVTITNTVTTKGYVKVTKSFSGISALPEGFQITNDFNSDVFTVSNASGDGSVGNPYTWIIESEGLAIGRTVHFTETGYDAAGYVVTINGKATAAADANTAAATAALTPDSTIAASFVNEYVEQPGSLKIRKTVTVNGTNAADSSVKSALKALTDGTYTFTVESKEKDQTNVPISSKTVTVTFVNGAVTAATVEGVQVIPVDGEVTVENLKAGTYIVKESPTTNGTSLVGNNGIEVVVSKNNSSGIQTAAFTNNIDTGNLSLTKTVSGKTDTTTEFAFEIALTPPQGVTLAASYPAERTNHTELSSVAVADGKITGIMLKAGETIVIRELPAGTSYKITELLADQQSDAAASEAGASADQQNGSAAGSAGTSANQESGAAGDEAGTAANPYTGYQQGTTSNLEGIIPGRNADSHEISTVSASVENVFAAEDATTFKAKKTYLNGNLKDKQFSFRLSQIAAIPENGAAPQVINTKLSQPVVKSTSTEDGSTQDVTFDNITFTQQDIGETYYFMIEEVNIPNDLDSNGISASEHIRYDLSKHYFTLMVQEKDGKLLFTKTGQYLGDDRDTAKFTNELLGSLKITKAMTVNGSELTDETKEFADGTFTFDVYTAEAYDSATRGEPFDRETITVTDGVAAPEAVEITNLPAGEYVVVEHTVGFEAAGIRVTQPTDGVSRVLVTAGKTGDAVETRGIAAFTNDITKKGSLRITKQVTLNGESTTGTLVDGTYTFAITDSEGQAAAGKVLVGQDKRQLENGRVSITITNGAASTVEVTDLYPGEYTVTEVADGTGESYHPDVAIDTEAKTVTVAPGVTGEAAALVTVTNNRPYVTVQPAVTKALTSADSSFAWPEDLRFDFTLHFDSAQAGTESIAYDLADQTATATKEVPTAAFGELSFSKPGIYTFSITEQKPESAPAYISYDTTPKRMVVTVAEDGEQAGKLTATVKYDGADSLTVYNVCEAKAHIQGRKIFENGGADSGASGFTFTLSSEEEGAPMPAETEAVSGVNGEFTFGDMTYGIDLLKDVEAVNGIKTRTYTYKVREKAPTVESTGDQDVSGQGETTESGAEVQSTEATDTADAAVIVNGIKYDTSEKTVTVTLAYDEAAHLLTATVEPSEAGALTFTNEQLGSLEITKTMTRNGEAPENDAEKAVLDGTFTFNVYKATEYDAHAAGNGDALTPVATETIEVVDGVALRTALVADLSLGDYVVVEDQTGFEPDLSAASPENGVSRVTVTAGTKTQPVTAAFTNDLKRTSYSARKVWEEGYDTTGHHVTLTLKRKFKLENSDDFIDDDSFAEDVQLPLSDEGLSEEEQWTAHWPDLAVKGTVDGETVEWAYYAEETAVSLDVGGTSNDIMDHFTVSGSGFAYRTADGSVQIIKNEVKTTEISFTKIWRTNSVPMVWPKETTGDGNERDIVIAVTLTRTLKDNAQDAILEQSITIYANHEKTYIDESESSQSGNLSFSRFGVGTAAIYDEETGGYTFKITGLERFRAGSIGEWEYSITEAQVPDFNAPWYEKTENGDTKQYRPAQKTKTLYVLIGEEENVKIYNDKITVALPATGGAGTSGFIGIGSMLLALGAGLFIIRRRRLS